MPTQSNLRCVLLAVVPWWALLVDAGLALAETTGAALFERAAAAHSNDAQIEFETLIETASPQAVGDFAKWAMATKRSDIRLLAALALSRLESGELADALFASLTADPSEAVRENAWLAMGDVLLSDERVQQGLAATDPIVRASVVVRIADVERLERCMVDQSPLVRAMAVRRLAWLAGEQRIERHAVEKPLRVGLVDANRLVRSNAVIAAGQLRWMPDDIAPGLLLDARAILPLEDLLGPKAECADWRRRNGIARDFYPTIHRLLRLQLQHTQAVDGRLYPIVALDDNVLIGSLAAKAYCAAAGERASKQIRTMLDSPQPGSSLHRQLQSVLKYD